LKFRRLLCFFIHSRKIISRKISKIGKIWFYALLTKIMISFEEYLIQKKINSKTWQSAESEKWQSFKTLFEQVHPDSFTAQKKFLINDLRRMYPLE